MAVTVWGPLLVTVQMLALQLPSGEMVNVDPPAMSNNGFAYWSAAVAVKVCDPPAAIVLPAGVTVMAANSPAVTSIVCEALVESGAAPLLALTV